MARKPKNPPPSDTQPLSEETQPNTDNTPASQAEMDEMARGGPTLPDGTPDDPEKETNREQEARGAERKVFVEQNPPRTVGEQPSGTPPLTSPSRDERDRPGADVQFGQEGQAPTAATQFPAPDAGEVSDEELERQRLLAGQEHEMGRDPGYIVRGAPDDRTGMSVPKIDPVDRQANVELPTGAVKVDAGSREATHLTDQTAADLRKENPDWAAGYAFAMKQARGEI